MSSRLRLSTLFAHVDQPALRDIAEHLLDAGHDRKKVVDDIVAAIDAAIPFAVLVPGAIGTLLESVDGPLARMVANLIVGAVEKARAHRQASAPAT